MKTNTMFNSMMILLMAGIVSMPSFAKQAQNNFFVDLLILQDGKSIQDAESYFDKVAPIAARHGLVRIHGFNVAAVYSGDSKPDLANLWTMAHDKVFKDINNDPEYKKMIPTRNSIFDMKHSHMFLLDQK
ncbi:MAG: hypothetical protein V7785_19535 [Bermanella sp.]